MRIMAADDSASIRQMIAFSLRQANYDVIEAENGRDAIRKLNGATVDMLITDLDMPEMGGMELVRRVRAVPKYRLIPIIVLTTESDPSLKQKIRKLGANGWITKPFKPKQLVSITDKFLTQVS